MSDSDITPRTEYICGTVQEFVAWALGFIAENDQKKLPFARVIANRLQRQPSVLEHIILMFELTAIWPHIRIICKLQTAAEKMPLRKKGLIMAILPTLNWTENFNKRTEKLCKMVEGLQLEKISPD